MSEEKAIARVEPAPIVLAQDTLHKLMLEGDIAKLKPDELCQYYGWYCNRLGLDPATQPFQVLKLKGKTVLYAGRGCCAQLTQKNRISHQIVSRDLIGQIYVVTGRASLPDGRFVDSTGAVSICGLRGDDLANAYMKAETKCKRRATLDLVGLGCTDETEIETIPNAQTAPAPLPPGMNHIEAVADVATIPLARTGVETTDQRGGPDEAPLTDAEAPAGSEAPKADPEAVLSKGRLIAIIEHQEAGNVADREFKAHLAAKYKIASRTLIKNKWFDEIRNWLAKGGADKTEREEIEGAFLK